MEGDFMGVFVFILLIGYTSLGAAEYFMVILQENDQCRDGIMAFAIYILTVRFYYTHTLAYTTVTYCAACKRKLASQMELTNYNWYKEQKTEMPHFGDGNPYF